MHCRSLVLDTSDYLPRIYVGESAHHKVKITISACPPYDNQARREIAGLVFEQLAARMPESSVVIVTPDRIEIKEIELPITELKVDRKCEMHFTQDGWKTGKYAAVS